MVLSSNPLFTQAEGSLPLEPHAIQTRIGQIAVYQRVVPNTVPVIFIHGVYYDHHLWNYYTERIQDRTVISVDMPLHGKSKNIPLKNWQLEDCAQMLIDILDQLGHSEAYAIGHSWGSMTILRAAAKHPDRFKAIGLCNMPVAQASLSQKLAFGFQHLMLPFRKFYTGQVSKVMFSAASRAARPELKNYLESTMSLLSQREIRKTDRAVITQADDGQLYLQTLQVPALALKGEEDYVPRLQQIETTVIPGAHTSPLERPKEVLIFIQRVLRE